MAKKNKVLKTIAIIFGILIFLGLLGVGGYFLLGMKGEPENISMKAILVDENGNKIGDVGSSGTSQSIISQSGQTGFNVISPDTCVSPCVFLAFETALDNSAGDSEVTVTSVTGSNPCSDANPNKLLPACTGISNIFGVVGSKKGGLTGLAGGVWNTYLPYILPKSQISSTVTSTGMALDTIALGLIDFTMSIGGTYLDANGIPQTLTVQPGKSTLLINPQKCSDNTPADTNNADADSVSFCSTAKPKYCRVDAYGIPQLVDHAGTSTGFAGCGCPSGQHVVGQSCVLDAGCTTGTCISGTVNFCLDGATGAIETRCQQCGVANCPLDANEQSATSCNPATSGVVSQCVYPPVSGSGFTISVVDKTFTPIATCGDGVKNGAEQCDTNDLGGASCTSLGYSGGTLTCNAPPACTYNVGSCTSAYVKFRTLFATISGVANVDEIAFMPTPTTQCTTPPATLTKAGEYGTGGGGSGLSNCATKMSSLSATKVLDITNGAITIIRSGSYPTGTINKALWADDTVGTYFVCGDDSDGIGYAYTAFRTGISAPTVSDSRNTLDSTKEQAC